MNIWQTIKSWFIEVKEESQTNPRILEEDSPKPWKNTHAVRPTPSVHNISELKHRQKAEADSYARRKKKREQEDEEEDRRRRNSSSSDSSFGSLPIWDLGSSHSSSSHSSSGSHTSFGGGDFGGGGSGGSWGDSSSSDSGGGDSGGGDGGGGGGGD